MRKRIAAVLAVSAVAVGMSVGTAGAKIDPASCTNNGGHSLVGSSRFAKVAA